MLSRVAAVCSVAAATACGGRSNDDQTNAAVLATVNDRPVTAAELDRAALPTGAANPMAKAQAVTSLVNEELLVQGAEKEHMEREPTVARAIERSRRQILAQAFAERHVYPPVGISYAQTLEFYESHPVLFAQRKRFRIKHYTFPETGLDAALRAAIENLHSDADLRELLDERDIRYTVMADTLTADQLPLGQLSAFEHAAVGDVMEARANGDAVLILITAIQDDDAISFDRARPLIEEYLSNWRNREAVIAYLSRAKANAKIRFLTDVKFLPRATQQSDQEASAIAHQSGTQ